jgi:hypothetical protein
MARRNLNLNSRWRGVSPPDHGPSGTGAPLDLTNLGDAQDPEDRADTHDALDGAVVRVLGQPAFDLCLSVFDPHPVGVELAALRPPWRGRGRSATLAVVWVPD